MDVEVREFHEREGGLGRATKLPDKSGVDGVEFSTIKDRTWITPH